MIHTDATIVPEPADGEGEPPVAPLSETPTAGPNRRRRAVPMLAVALAMALVGGAVALLGRAGDAGRAGSVARPVLRFAGAAGSGTDSRSEPALMPIRPTRYVHDGAWTPVGTDAVVLRISVPAVDAALVRRLAGGFGIAGEPVRTETGWTVRDAALELGLTVDQAAGSAWISVGGASSGGGATTGSPGSAGTPDQSSVPGSSGSGVAKPGAVPGGGDPTVPAPPVPSEPPVPSDPTVPAPPVPSEPPAPPVRLLSPADAEARARAMLDAAGVLGTAEWRVTVADGGVVSATVCAPNADCPTPSPGPATSRLVTFQAQRDGRDINGLAWYVELGDAGTLLGANGPLGALAPVDSYPLRAIDTAFADLQAGRTGWPGEPVPLAVTRDAASSSGAPSSGAPGTAPDNDPVVATIDRVEVAWVVVTGSIDGRNATLVVPVYRFSGTTAGSAGRLQIDVAALDPSVVQPSAPAAPGPQPKEPQPTGVEPQPAPAASTPGSPSDPGPGPGPGVPEPTWAAQP